MTGTAGNRRLSRNRSPVCNPGSCARAGGSRRRRPSPPTGLGARPLRPTGRRTSSCPQPTGHRYPPGADDGREGGQNARALSRRCRRPQSLATMVRQLGIGAATDRQRTLAGPRRYARHHGSQAKASHAGPRDLEARHAQAGRPVLFSNDLSANRRAPIERRSDPSA